MSQLRATIILTWGRLSSGVTAGKITFDDFGGCSCQKGQEHTMFYRVNQFITSFPRPPISISVCLLTYLHTLSVTMARSYRGGSPLSKCIILSTPSFVDDFMFSYNGTQSGAEAVVILFFKWPVTPCLSDIDSQAAGSKSYLLQPIWLGGMAGGRAGLKSAIYNCLALQDALTSLTPLMARSWSCEYYIAEYTVLFHHNTKILRQTDKKN